MAKLKRLNVEKLNTRKFYNKTKQNYPCTVGTISKALLDETIFLKNCKFKYLNSSKTSLTTGNSRSAVHYSIPWSDFFDLNNSLSKSISVINVQQAGYSFELNIDSAGYRTVTEFLIIVPLVPGESISITYNKNLTESIIRKNNTGGVYSKQSHPFVITQVLALD